MKISELINKLNQIITQYDDLEVLFLEATWDEGGDGTMFRSIEWISESPFDLFNIENNKLKIGSDW